MVADIVPRVDSEQRAFRTLQVREDNKDEVLQFTCSSIALGMIHPLS